MQSAQATTTPPPPPPHHHPPVPSLPSERSATNPVCSTISSDTNVMTTSAGPWIVTSSTFLPHNLSPRWAPPTLTVT